MGPSSNSRWAAALLHVVLLHTTYVHGLRVVRAPARRSPGGCCNEARSKLTRRVSVRMTTMGSSGDLMASRISHAAATSRQLWKFTRPHTFIGSALCVPALHLFAAPVGSPACGMSTILRSCFWALVPALFINVYITGLNQITDVDIDRVNKPDLPLASGGLTMAQAQWMVSSCLFAGLALGSCHPVYSSPALRMTLVMSAIIGTAYSLEPFRLKRFPLFAALCILTVRGAVVNVGFFAHALGTCWGHSISGIQEILMLPFSNAKCGLATLFFAVFGTIIALMKDIPDIAGDRQFNIRSFTVRLGTARVFLISRMALSALLYVTGAGILWSAARAPFGLASLGKFAVGFSSIGSAFYGEQQALAVDASDSKAVYTYYMYLWKLFYLAYILLPFLR